MKQAGPPLHRLTSRIAECPADFLDEPQIDQRGRLAVAALVGDCLRNLGYRAAAVELDSFRGAGGADRHQLQLVALCIWLIHDEWFKRVWLDGATLLSLLIDDLGALSKTSRVEKCLKDPERREEFARLVLARLGYRPEGESGAQASDRLVALSSIERQRLLKESQAAERRAREIREALARKAAEESADKWTRE